jgi:hypothetical protein
MHGCHALYGALVVDRAWTQQLLDVAEQLQAAHLHHAVQGASSGAECAELAFMTVCTRIICSQ